MNGFLGWDVGGSAGPVRASKKRARSASQGKVARAGSVGSVGRSVVVSGGENHARLTMGPGEEDCVGYYYYVPVQPW